MKKTWAMMVKELHEPFEVEPVTKEEIRVDAEEYNSLLKVKEAAKDVLQFVRDKYSVPGEPFEFTCGFHQRLDTALKELDGE